MTEPRAHHYVPQFYLRAFANAREQLIVERRDRSKRFHATVKRAAMRKDFYTLESAEGVPSLDVERRLSKIEQKAAPVLKSMISGQLPNDDDTRAAFASYVALQFLRGTDHRAAAEKLIAWAGKFVLKNLTPELVAEKIRDGENREPQPDEIDEFLDFVERGEVIGKHLKPHPNQTITMTLSGLDGLARIALVRTIRLLHWKEPVLLTSDAPVALYSSRPPPPMMGLGFGTADQIVLPLNRCMAAVLYAPQLKQPETVWENPQSGFATMINYLVAENAMESIFVHPDDAELLSDLVDLPPVRERGVMSPAEPFRIAPPRKRAR